jgi:TonB family protein
LASEIARAAGTIREKGSTSTAVEMPGGPGGEFFANYKQVVQSIYDAAWIAPAEVSDDAATVKAQIVIAKSGRVISAEILRNSGVPALDKSVRKAIDLDFIAPFPAGSKDEQRTFIINFNLKSKRAIG